MHKHRLERVLVLNDEGGLAGLITVKDMMKSTEHPLASKDSLGRLRVGAASASVPAPKSARCWPRPAST
jgi:IMP dehydrogenase